MLSFQCLSEGELKNFGRPHALLYDETSVLCELTKKLSSVERQVIHDIVNASLERHEKSQLGEKYEKLKSLKPPSQFQATSTDNDEDSEYDRKMADVNEYEDEKRAILSRQKSNHSSYGSTD